MLQVSAVLLLVHLGLYALLERRWARQREAKASAADGAASDRTAPDEAANEASPSREATDGGFQLILNNRYLWWIALFFVVLNLVNTTGEYILSAFVEDAAREAVAAGNAASMEAYIGRFYGNFFSVVNVAAVVLQAFVVSRLLKGFGMRGMIFALPVVALGTYGLAAFGVGLAAFRWVKTAENSTDYSIMNTTRALVWLPTTRMEKYAAKQTIDTFFVRVGDVLSAGVVFVGTTWLQFQPQQFAYTNLVLVALWMGIGALVYRSFRRLSDERGVTAEDLEAEVQ
jgi:AAA family ATP:ADP antiporter